MSSGLWGVQHWRRAGDGGDSVQAASISKPVSALLQVLNGEKPALAVFDVPPGLLN